MTLTGFADRVDAGRKLAGALETYRGRRNTVVVGLPRGGVPVAYEVASALGLPLDVLVVRKLGFPGQEELAMGAIAVGGVIVSNPEVQRWLEHPDQAVRERLTAERAELERRAAAYRGTRPPLEVAGKTVIVVDDGAATGATMRAAVQALRKSKALHIVVALPVASTEAHEALSAQADRVVCLVTSDAFGSVGQWYEVFDQTSDAEVLALLRSAQPPPV